MAKNYFERYIWLIDTINRHGHISFKRISDLWEYCPLNDRRGEPLSNRTFFNHLESIYDTFGIEIKCDRSLGYYIANSDDLEGDSIRQWLLESLSMNNLLNETKDMRDRILFEKIPSSQRWLSTIVNAMKDGKAVDLTYQSYNRTEPNTFEAHTYCLKLFRQRWYMVALSTYYNEDRPRIYCLDRIKYLEIKDETFKMPRDWDAKEYFSDSFGIIANPHTPIQRIKLKVSAGQANYLRDLKLHNSQQEIERNDEYSIFAYCLRPEYDFIQEILRNGDDIEVLEPQNLREEVATIIENLHNKYKEN